MNFLKKLFGSKSSAAGSPEAIVEDTLKEVFQLGQFDLTASVRTQEDKVVVEVEGADAEMLKERDGQLLDAFQFFMKRVVQHQLPDVKIDVEFDTDGYREESSQALIELAEKLKAVALEKGKSVYIRALAPKDRKVVHQHLATDERVRSKSIGDGHYKKIKIYPTNGKRNSQQEESAQSAES